MIKNRYWILVMVAAFLLAAGCISSRITNTAITVTTDELDNFVPVNTGSFDFYTMDFQVENPTNMTFENIEVQIRMMPITAYCHSQSATFDIPSMTPHQKLRETFSFSEFADLDCAYNFSSSVTSDQP
ncbi:MAG: hypothetical protein WAU64_05050 [Methanoregula sp.]|uniref:hypothetical protein n=1 Tax=Methanoregula sp. TaxID=2052170 RepID=UPI003BAF5E9C